MKTLWTFGDSLTFGHGAREDGPLTEYYYNYKTEGDDIWPALLANKLEMNLQNCGKCGASNDYILDNMIINFDNINEGDYVILGKSYFQRFDVKDIRTNTLSDITTEINVSLKKKEKEDWYKKIKRSPEEVETLVNFMHYFSSDDLFKNRQDLRFNFIKKRLINEKKIEFFHEWSDNLIGLSSSIHRIFQHTNGKINDQHFSFIGHKQMFDYFYYLIQNNGIKKLI